jgi:hypothetical protein
MVLEMDCSVINISFSNLVSNHMEGVRYHNTGMKKHQDGPQCDRESDIRVFCFNETPGQIWIYPSKSSDYKIAIETPNNSVYCFEYDPKEDGNEIFPRNLHHQRKQSKNPECSFVFRTLLAPSKPVTEVILNRFQMERNTPVSLKTPLKLAPQVRCLCNFIFWLDGFGSNTVIPDGLILLTQSINWRG